MRNKVMIMLFMGCVLATALGGCSKKAEESEVFENILENNVKNEKEGDELSTEVVEKSNADDSGEKMDVDLSENNENDSTTVEQNEETAGSVGEAEGGEDSEESQAYILTFEASTVEGEAWNSDKLANAKLTMINIWATYCNPCLAEMPDLGELAGAYDEAEFQLVGIISDVMEGDAASNVEYAKELIAETRAEYPHLLLNESLYVNLLGPGQVSAVPTTFFVNQDSEVLGYVMGSQSKEIWKSLIDQLLAEME